MLNASKRKRKLTRSVNSGMRFEARGSSSLWVKLRTFPSVFRSVAKRIVRRLGERGSVNLGSRPKFIIPGLPKKALDFPWDYVRPCVASRCLARKGTSGPIVFLHEQREAGRVGIYTA